MNRPTPVVYTDPTLVPPQREMWTSPDMTPARGKTPVFYTDEVAKTFFGMSPSWVRLQLAERFEVNPGEPFDPPRSSGGHRAFRLYDVEVWAHVLARQNVISGQQLEYVIAVVRDIARVHRFIV